MKEGRKKIEFLEKLEKATRINRNDLIISLLISRAKVTWEVSSDLNCSLSGYRCIRCNSLILNGMYNFPIIQNKNYVNVILYQFRLNDC